MRGCLNCYFHMVNVYALEYLWRDFPAADFCFDRVLIGFGRVTGFALRNVVSYICPCTCCSNKLVASWSNTSFHNHNALTGNDIGPVKLAVSG